MHAPKLPFPERLSPAERALEIATILALAILRTHASEGRSETLPGLGFSAEKRDA